MVQGLAALNKKLTVTIPAKVEAATRKAMEKGADELVEMMKRLVPVNTGALRDSIGWTWGDAPKGSVVLTKTEADSRGLKITVYSGDKDAFYARWVEFGTHGKMGANYFFGSYRTLRRRIKSRITREMKKAIKAESANG